MPMAERDRILPVNPPLSPPGTAQLVSISVIAILPYVINTRTAVTIVVIIRLPHAAIGIACLLLGIAEIITNNLQFLSLGIIRNCHPLQVSLPPCTDYPALKVVKRHPMLIQHRFTLIPRVKIK